MKEVLLKLTELQKIDTQLHKIESVRGDLPQRVKKLELDVKNHKDACEKLEQDILNAQKERDQVELEIKELESKKTKYQDQLYEVKNNREYDAVTQEIEAVTGLVSEKESRVLQLMGIEEELKELIETNNASVETLENDLKIQTEALNQTLAKTEKEESELLKQREVIIKDMDKKILSSYERIRKAKNGLAVVPVLNKQGVCGGCFKNLPPQRVLEIREMKRLFLCEVCGRMLVWNQNAYNLSQE